MVLITLGLTAQFVSEGSILNLFSWAIINDSMFYF